MSHQIIRIEGKWAIKTGWTEDYRAVNQTVKRAPQASFDWDLRVWFIKPQEDILRTIEVLEELQIEVPEDLMEQARSLTRKMDENAVEADKLAGDKRLFSYQVDGIKTLARMGQFILSDDMGCGKTVQALLAIPTDAPVLAVVPANVKGNWLQEIALWRPGVFKVEILEGRKSFRFPKPGEFLITNWAILPPELNDPKHISPEFEAKVPSGLVIIGDEIHRAKNRKAKRTLRYQALNQLASEHAGKCWGLTGTPLLNRPPELWALLEVMGLAEKAFGNFGNFYQLFNARKDSFGTTWGSPEPEVPELLSKVWLRRMKTDVLPQLPPKRRQEIPISITDKKTLRSLENLQKKIDSGEIKVLKNGLPSFEDMSEQRRALAIAKIPALLEMVESHEQTDTPVVVFSAHRDPINVLGKREGWVIITGNTEPLERTQIVQDFQNGKYKGIGLTIKAGCEGITLTKASNMIFVDLEWVPALNTQAEDRIYRIGQDDENGCLYKILVANHALDQRMAKILTEKIKMIQATVQACTSKVANGASKLLEKVKSNGGKVQEAKIYNCPCCDKTLLPQTSNSEKNPGREYVTCKDCSYFAWTDVNEAKEDVDICPTCKRVCVVRVTKKEGKNKGRRFVNCPCCGFVWVDPPKPKEKKLSRSEQVVFGKRNYGDFKGGEPVVRKHYTEKQTQQFIRELYSLLSVCDGAQTDDYKGFNSPDAPIARQFAKAIQEGKGVSWKALGDMLVKYRNTQLGDS